jgi:hypothetical protein
VLPRGESPSRLSFADRSDDPHLPLTPSKGHNLSCARRPLDG